MSGECHVPFVPFHYMVPDSAAPPGMELQTRSPGPFHYLINEQAKSLVALQELQNEVGALLEFRDLVMDTFPHLRHKMAPTSPSPTSHSHIPPPLASSLNAGCREWEPGIRVRRKLTTTMSSLPRRKATSSSQPKSGETSSNSSAVQDSGFSTETSSKEHCSTVIRASPKDNVVLDEAEDELWNLLDVIQRKGTKLRDEVECLQEKLHRDEGKESDASLDGGEGLAYLEEDSPLVRSDFKTGGSMRCVMDQRDHVRELTFERDFLLDKVAEMEAEVSSARARASRLKTEVGVLCAAKREVEGLATGSSDRLGTLDGVVTSPGVKLAGGLRLDEAKVTAILTESNPLELRRHLLTSSVDNQNLQHRLDCALKSQAELCQQLDKIKEDNEDLHFQLEEKKIELEGTKAQVRVLEKSHTKSEVTSADAPRKRPSKIPLGTKTYTAPRPPSSLAASTNGRNSSLKNSINGRLKDSSLGRLKDSSLGSNKLSSYSSINGSRNKTSLHRQRMSSMQRNVQEDVTDVSTTKIPTPEYFDSINESASGPYYCANEAMAEYDSLEEIPINSSHPIANRYFLKK